MNNLSTGDSNSPNVSSGRRRHSSTYDCLYKLVVIGDSGVGKSCLVNRFVDGTFTDTFNSTIGVEFKVKTVSFDGKTIKSQVWDTAGQERFRSVTNAYYRGASGIILVYDVTKKHTFENLEYWSEQIIQYAHKDVVVLMLGNKCDLEEQRQVDFDEAFEFAVQNGMHLIEASAKVDSNVEKAFVTLIAAIKARNNNPHITGHNGRTVPIAPEPKQSKCFCF